jgi:hypothetical protein
MMYVVCVNTLYSVAILYVSIEYAFMNFNSPRFYKFLHCTCFSMPLCLVYTRGALPNDDRQMFYTSHASFISLMMAQKGPKHVDYNSM